MKNNKVKIKIQQIYAGLRPSEQKVADYILSYEGKASRLLMETLALETGVSQPTVIRFVKAAGFEGFKDFKYALVREEAKEQPEDNEKIGLYGFPLSKKDRLEDIPGKIVTTSVEMLDETLKNISMKEYRRAVEAVLKAENIVIYSVENSVCTANDPECQCCEPDQERSGYRDLLFRLLPAYSGNAGPGPEGRGNHSGYDKF